MNHIEKTGYEMLCDTIAYNIKKIDCHADIKRKRRKS